MCLLFYSFSVSFFPAKNNVKKFYMKQIRFETSKGSFILLDVDYNSMFFVRILDTATACLGSEELFDYKESFKLSEITEEEASEIVEAIDENVSFKTSLNILLKSKGIYLFENPFPDVGLIPCLEQQLYREAKQKTFYNPYIFKL